MNTGKYKLKYDLGITNGPHRINKMFFYSKHNIADLEHIGSDLVRAMDCPQLHFLGVV